MTTDCRHSWGAWSPAWRWPGHSWWRVRACHDCGITEHGRDTLIPVGRDREVVRTIPIADPFAQIGLALAEVFADGTMADKQEA